MSSRPAVLAARSALLSVALMLGAAAAVAQDEDALSPNVLAERFKASESPEPAVWVQGMYALADPAARDLVRAAIVTRAPYPRKELVGLLSDRRLAVRLGALDLLEEAAGGTFGFVPWSGEEDPGNAEALARWNEWAAADDDVQAGGPVLSDDQMRSYLRDLLSDDRARAKRSLRMLEPHGMAGVKAIQDFLHEHGDLPVGHRARLKEAQYYLVLVRSARDSAAVLARDLVFGNRDQRLAALAGLKRTGLNAIPIVRDYLDSSDALVRETAIDSFLSLGGSQVLDLAQEILAGEEDINVIHSAIRCLKEVPGRQSIDLILPYLKHEDEDLVISAIQALGSLGGDSSRIMTSGLGGSRNTATEADKQVLPRLEDGRWRIRATALEYVQKRRVSGADETIVKLLGDDDEFVRYRAVEAVVSLGLRSAIDQLKGMFFEDDGMIGPVAKAYSQMEQGFDAEMIAHLESRGPDTIISALRALESTEAVVLDVVARFAGHDNLDVSCAALRQLASDEDNVQVNKYASVLLSGMRSGVTEKLSSIMESLRLPRDRSRIDPRIWDLVMGDEQPGEPTALDPLYEAFSKVLEGAAQEEPDAGEPAAPQEIEEVKGALAEIMKELQVIVRGEGAHSHRAAFLLATAGDSEGARWYASRMSELSSAQRSELAEYLYTVQNEDFEPVMTALLRDPVAEIRKDAAETCFSTDGNPVLVQAALREVRDDEQPIAPHEAYGWGFERVAKDQTMGRLLGQWAREVLADQEAANPVRILAMIGLRAGLRRSDVEAIEELTRSADQWERRAAWYALAGGRAGTFRNELERLIGDPSPLVRAVLPEVSNRLESSWHHIFDDLHRVRSSDSDYYRAQRRLDAESRDALEKLASDDPSEEVRFEAMFALMSHGRTIDLDAFIAMIPRQPKEASVAYRLARYFNTNAQTVGRGLRPLLAFADLDYLRGDSLQQLLARMAGPEGEAGFVSFDSLVESASASEPQHSGEIAAVIPEVARTALNIVYFFKPGCDECARVDHVLEELKNEFPLLNVMRTNILHPEGTILNQALCEKFGVPSKSHTLAPSVFSQGGFLIHSDIQPGALGTLLASTMSLPMEEGWFDLGEQAIEVAKEKLDMRYDALSLAVVIGAGAFDGVNPCAFATIIFFLSYLQVAKRSAKEILMVGIAFISAVFLAYFVVGLVMHEFIDRLAEISWMQSALKWTFAGFALLVAVLSFRDGLRARRGRLGEMTLQLPGFLKEKIRTVIRKHARARNFVIAAFVAGIIISFLELACTGQVYAPIIYQIQQGNLNAVHMLVLYNLAFITPLVVVFGLAYGGMRSEALIAFQQNHTAAVKFGLAGLFLALCLLLVFGQSLLSLGAK